MKRKLIAILNASTAAVICLLVIPTMAMISPFLGWGFMGATALHAGAHPRRVDVLFVATAAAVLLLRAPFNVNSAIYALGMGSLIVMTFRTSAGQMQSTPLTIAAAILFFIFVVDAVHILIAAVTPQVIDETLRKADAQFGFQPSALAQSLRRYWPPYAAIATIYLALPFAAATVLAYSTPRRPVVRVLLAAAVLSVPCYLFLPAIGPAHVQDPHPESLPRNCMPSLHLAWALLLFWNSKAGPLRILTSIFLVGTAIGTMVTGEHYLIDLVIAFPFALTVQSVFGEKRNLRVGAIALLTTVSWMLGIAYISRIPVMPILSLLTAATCLPAGARMSRATVSRGA